ncbi:MAG: SAM-dependent methyltransferase, partial [Acidimicrobiales bacterium]
MTRTERFDRYMEACLYGPGGFYAGEGTAGRRAGDFITNPEVGPLFGAVLAEALDSWWQELGEPDGWPIYDVGCGPGTLLQTVRLARPDRPWRYIGIDRVDSDGAEAADLPDDLSGAAVVANELLDNLPFRVVERSSDGLSEVFVVDVDGRPQETLQPIDPEDEPAAEILAGVPIGSRVPVLGAARGWVSSTLARNPAKLCLFDYGAPTTAELATRGGWLRTYRQHQRGSDPLAEPGAADITTDVAWDQLPTPTGLSTQADFLRRWGIDALVEEGRRHWADHASAPDLTAIRMRSRIS